MKPALHSFCLLAFLGGPACAATDPADDYFALPLESLIEVETAAQANVGSRRNARTAYSATVPIDVITATQLEHSGEIELARALATLLPGFNYPRPSIADGTDHSPPFTLRALNPDQVLVLINGKRLHQGALLHTNGTIGRGSSGTDLNVIPLSAVERVEILRDGAAAQYGSDAIAGIINIVLKGYGHRSHFGLRYGRSSAGDGISRQASLLQTIPLAHDGFINLTAEWRDRGATNRAGADALDGGRVNLHFGDARSKDALLSLNGEIPRGDLSLYAHGHFNERRSSAGAFFRRSDDPRNVPAIYPDGYLPSIHPLIRDYNLTAGIRGVSNGSSQWDISYTLGKNDFAFRVRDSLNRSLGEQSPRSFDSGSLDLQEQVFNADFSHQWGRHVLALGYEFRHQRYRIHAGELASWQLGSESPWFPGAQGFEGFRPENALSATRQSQAVYADLTTTFSPQLSVDGAVRAEHFSDFGTTLDGKLALRLRPHRQWLLRSSLSSGFRAPSMSQTHFNATSMIRDGEEIVEYGSFSVDHPVARALGARKLKAEKSHHLTAGLLFEPSANLNASADLFITDIDDRIMSTGYIASWNLAALSPEAQAILLDHHVNAATYFTNALATRTRGLDLRLDYHHEFRNGGRLRLNAAYQYARTLIRKVNPSPSVLGVNMGALVLDPYTRVSITDGQPVQAFRLWALYSTAAVDLAFNLNRHGSFFSTKGDEKYKFAARWTLDTELAWRVQPKLTLAIGATNLFNAKPTEWGTTDDSLMGSGKPVRYSQYAPFGYNGTSYHLRLGLSF